MQQNLVEFSAHEMAEGLIAGDFTSVELVEAHYERIAAVDEQIHAFLHLNKKEALETAKEVDQDRKAGKKLPYLAGVPIAIKDLIVTVGQPTTAGSKMLEGWESPYDATVITKIRENRMPILGKTNLDEFAMGSSTEHSAYGITRNPWDLERIPGGSGGGSAAAVAAFEAPLALGTDTGGSIRQPGAVTGTVGTKPTYGGVSRYGSIAMASSLDQIGPVARNVLDTALLHEVIGGHDSMDATSLAEEVPEVVNAAKKASVKGMKIGVVTELSGEGYQKGVEENFNESIKTLEELGAEIIEVSCPHFKYALGAYYLIMPSEMSSNLARFDAVRYGLRVDDGAKTIEQVMSASRKAGFGAEVKRRIILGTYALSAGSYDAYYGSAQKVRTLIQEDFTNAFGKVDVLVSPTSPITAFKFGEKLDDPVAMYKNDIATIPANLAGVPGITVPNGLAKEDDLPTGFQILASAKSDAALYQVAAALETALEEKWDAPLLAKLPELKEETRG
ncbi:MAG: Asp-tRNA(Asn)/Glu-tRNA(Gln) amidotransferase subunit GatA [Micrococcaceae bacterium]